MQASAAAIMHRRPRRRNGHHPIQGPQDRSGADVPAQRRGVHAPLPPTRAPARLPQGALLRPVAPRATPQRRPGEANVATPGDTEVRSCAGLRCAAAHAIRRGAATIDRAADLPALSGTADLHPHALAAAGHPIHIRDQPRIHCRVTARAMEICCHRCNVTPAY